MRSARRLLGLLMVLALFVLAACSGAKSPSAGSNNQSGGATSGKKIKAALIVSGLGDRSFNDMGWDGLKRAEKELGGKVQVKVQEAPEIASVEENAVQYAKDGYDLIMFLSFTYTDVVKKVAPQFPNTKFVMVDTEIKDIPNVRSILFRDHEGSFLAGAMAALKSTTGKVGFLGGKDIPLIQRFGYGFEQGAKYVNPNIEVQKAYVGAFNDAAKGKELALVMYNRGVDVIYSAAGGSGAGAIEAAKQAKKFAIGVDSNQDALAPENMLGSMMKRVDNAVFTAIKDTVDGKFTGGTVVLGVKEDGVGLSGLAPINSDISIKNVGKASLDKLTQIRQQIADGKITVAEQAK